MSLSEWKPQARKRVQYVQKILEDLGVETDRVAMYNMSAAQGPRFVEVAREFTSKIKELGPSPFRKPTTKAA